MPEKARLNKRILGKSVSKPEETRHSSPKEESRTLIPHERRNGTRRSGEAADPNDNPMDVALGTEGEDWDRRRSQRRKNAV